MAKAGRVKEIDINLQYVKAQETHKGKKRRNGAL